MLGSYLARMSSVYLRSRLRGRVSFLDEVRLPLRIWPTDIDIYLHVNNGRYLTLMDFGRLDHLVRTGGLPAMLRRQWIPVLGSGTVNFLREVRAFDRVELVTRLAFWDDKWFFYEHRLIRGEQLCAVGWVKGVIKHKGKTVSPVTFAQVMGHDGRPPPQPPELAQWLGMTAESAARG